MTRSQVTKVRSSDFPIFLFCPAVPILPSNHHHSQVTGTVAISRKSVSGLPVCASPYFGEQGSGQVGYCDVGKRINISYRELLIADGNSRVANSLLAAFDLSRDGACCFRAIGRPVSVRKATRSLIREVRLSAFKR